MSEEKYYYSITQNSATKNKHIWFLCPVCNDYGLIDDDQFNGRVSIDHSPEPNCTFHKTINVKSVGIKVKHKKLFEIRNSKK